MFQCGPDRRIYLTYRRACLCPAVKSHTAALLDAGDDGVHLVIEFGEHCLVVCAHIEAEMERAGHDGKAVRCGIGVEAANRAGHRYTLRVVCLPKMVERHREF